MDKVLVGVPGPWAKSYSEAADHYTSKIGGVPDWPLNVGTFESGLLDCGACGGSLSLVSQIYAPVNTEGVKIEERTIYIFGCVKPECGDYPGSWRALRLQRLPDGNAHEASTQEADPKLNVSRTKISLWDDDEDNVQDISLEELSKAFKDLASVTSHSSQENAEKPLNTNKTSVKDSSLNMKPQVISSSSPVLPCFYLYIQAEPSVKANKSKILPSDDVQINLPDEDAETWDKENYEYDRALSADRTYLKYKKVIDRRPDQCFRYLCGGKPLFATETKYTPSPCQLCNAPRHYEMQLMPPLVYFLHEGAEKNSKYSMDNWNWMTLIVYTCSKNCSSSHDGWTIAVEEIELQLEEKLAIFSTPLATGEAVSV